MARKPKPSAPHRVETLRHRPEDATRKNIPTAEYQPVLEPETQAPVRGWRTRSRRRGRSPVLDEQVKTAPDRVSVGTGVAPGSEFLQDLRE
jgi:adenine-specific DNA-methyltransferase